MATMRAAVLAATAAIAAATSLTALESIVQTSLGPVLGTVMDNGRAFTGIPYAMPPVNALRWQPPKPAVSWGPSIIQAIYDPPGCLQTCDSSSQPPHVCPPDVSEDCLYLNVYTPRLDQIKEPLPVVVFMHGGAFKEGYAGGLDYGVVYDARAWVNATSSIVVAINYRLGSMGFLYQGGSTSIQGNYGLMDQELAFQWVQTNIAAFGGDPKRVIISGQSAGAMSVASHLARPASAGLYSGAVLQSDPFALPFRNPSTGQALSNAFAKFSGCSDGSATANWTAVELCLRALNSSQIIQAQLLTTRDVGADLQRIIEAFVPWTPTYNTSYLPTLPFAAFQAGQVVDVPTIFGTVQNEGNLFINFAFNSSLASDKYLAALLVIMGLEKGLKVSAQYPVPSPAPADLRPHMSDIATDALFVCAVRNASASVAAAPGRRSPVFVYHFDHVESFNPAAWGTVYPFNLCWPIVCHGSELVELFHPEYPAIGTNYTTAENALSLSMQWYWSNLAAQGAPGVGFSGAPLLWPAYNATGRATMLLQTGGNSVLADYNTANCNFFDQQVGYDFY